MEYTGYIYIWWDTQENLYYVGGHKGKVEDSYVCSNTMLKGIHYRRPSTLRFRVLEYVYGDSEELRIKEQAWLNLIKAEELYLGTKPRYFNIKKLSAGGNGSANKGNSNIGGHNRISWRLIDPSGFEYETDSIRKFCESKGVSYNTLYAAARDGRKVKRGPSAGWELIKI